jgi:hypothetical protein
MYQYIKQIVTSNIFKPAVKAVFGLFTKQANPQAKAYADNVASEVADFMPTVVETAAAAVAAYQLGGLGLQTGLQFAAVMMDEKQSPTKDVVMSPAKMLHHYNNYKYLNGVTDGGYEHSDVEDDFVLINEKNTRPAI